MLRLRGILGHDTDAPCRERLHALEHHDGIELLFVPPEEAGRKRFRLATGRGTDCRPLLGAPIEPATSPRSTAYPVPDGTWTESSPLFDS